MGVLNDSEVLNPRLSLETVRHYGMRARAQMIARGVTERMAGGKIVTLPGQTRRRHPEKSNDFRVVSQIGHVSNFFKQPSVEARRIIEAFKALRDEAA